jgi:putative SOS response-associated peptidase YedK
MCGRYSITTPVEGLRQLFRFTGPALNLQPRWNVAPTQQAPVVRLAKDGSRELRMLHWGLVPFWAKDDKGGARMINARGETVAEKPAFREAFKARRCLVPVDGFFEWETLGDSPSKQPLLFRMADGKPFAFAGLWERWHPRDGGAPLETFTIVNTAANEIMAQYHDRVPIVLAPEDYAAWLDPAADARPLLKAPPSEWFTATRVSTRVNSVRNDDPECIAPLTAPEPLPPEAPKPAKKQKARDERQGSLF